MYSHVTQLTIQLQLTSNLHLTKEDSPIHVISFYSLTIHVFINGVIFCVTIAFHEMKSLKTFILTSSHYECNRLALRGRRSLNQTASLHILSTEKGAV